MAPYVKPSSSYARARSGPVRRSRNAAWASDTT